MNHRHGTPPGYSKRLSDAVLASGLSIPDIAKRAGLARSVVYYYIYNDVTPNITSFADLCKALNVSADWLLFGDKVPGQIKKQTNARNQ